jgi:hypothetical protein
VTPEDIYDVQDLDLYLELNGKRMQTGNTSTMIFTVAQIVSYLSKFMTLEPGDVIARHPAGRGQGRKPQRFLKKGDTLRLGIAGLGEQQAEVIAWQAQKGFLPGEAAGDFRQLRLAGDEGRRQQHVVAAPAVDGAAHRVDHQAARHRWSLMAACRRSAGSNGALLSRSATSSRPISKPRPRMSPTCGWSPNASRSSAAAPRRAR